MASSFVDRFRRLEIPEDKRRTDWSCLDAPLPLPEPLPLASATIAVLHDGQVWEPGDDASGPDRLLFYRDWSGLVARPSAAAAEASWRAAHAAELAQLQRRFLDAVPTEIVRDRRAEAVELLQLDATEAGLLDRERLLRIHGKLYDLRSLHDYVRIFERAIEPATFASLQRLPATCAPEDMLAAIAAALPHIHKKARSPLRNKMECTRLVLAGVTYLPVYREPAAALFDAWRRQLERQLKLASLTRHD